MEIGDLSKGKTYYMIRSQQVVAVVVVAIRDDQVVCEAAEKFVFPQPCDLFPSRIEAHLGLASDSRKSANRYLKAAEENHQKAVAEEAIAVRAIENARRLLNKQQ